MLETNHFFLAANAKLSVPWLTDSPTDALLTPAPPLFLLTTGLGLAAGACYAACAVRSASSYDRFLLMSVAVVAVVAASCLTDYVYWLKVSKRRVLPTLCVLINLRNDSMRHWGSSSATTPIAMTSKRPSYSSMSRLSSAFTPSFSLFSSDLTALVAFGSLDSCLMIALRWDWPSRNLRIWL